LYFQLLYIILTKSILSCISQWKIFIIIKIVIKRANFAPNSPLKTVRAKHNSVTAYQDLSYKCFYNKINIFNKNDDNDNNKNAIYFSNSDNKIFSY